MYDTEEKMNTESEQMKIKSIRLYDIEVTKEDSLIFQDRIENAPEELLNCDIKHIEFSSNSLKIQI